jgi:hypothetical protein
LHSELFFGPPLRAAHLVRKTLEGAPVHAPGLLWKWRQHARIATQPHPDVIGPSQRPLIRLLPLALVGEPVAVAAKEVAPRAVQLGDPPAQVTPDLTRATHWRGVRSDRLTGLLSPLPLAAQLLVEKDVRFLYSAASFLVFRRPDRNSGVLRRFWRQ